MDLEDSIVWYNFPTFAFNDIILDVVGSSLRWLSSSLVISIILFDPQIAGALPESRISVKSVAKSLWHAGSFERKPYIMSSSPGALFCSDQHIVKIYTKKWVQHLFSPDKWIVGFSIRETFSFVRLWFTKLSAYRLDQIKQDVKILVACNRWLTFQNTNCLTTDRDKISCITTLYTLYW